MAPEFPGEARRGIFNADETSRERSFARFADVPCPAFDPANCACALYPWSPLARRSFGLPVRFGGQRLLPCSLNFSKATPQEIAAATVAPDPGDVDGALLAECAPRDTLVCAVLGGAAGPRKRSR
jgi:hypothetical protein